eukprot:781700-Pleurochrysis_carterae.AAC.3
MRWRVTRASLRLGGATEANVRGVGRAEHRQPLLSQSARELGFLAPSVALVGDGPCAHEAQLPRARLLRPPPLQTVRLANVKSARAIAAEQVDV